MSSFRRLRFVEVVVAGCTAIAGHALLSIVLPDAGRATPSPVRRSRATTRARFCTGECRTSIISDRGSFVTRLAEAEASSLPATVGQVAVGGGLYLMSARYPRKALSGPDSRMGWRSPRKIA